MKWLISTATIFTLVTLYIKQGISNYARFSAWFMKVVMLHRDTIKNVLWNCRENLNCISQEAAWDKDVNGREQVLRYVFDCIVDVCGDLRDTISTFD